MNFLIMTRMPEIYSSQRLVQEITARGHAAKVINPEAEWPVAPCDIAIPRLGNFRYPEALAQFQKMERLNPKVHVLNPSAAFDLARHKKLAQQVLCDLPQPKLYSTADHFPLIVKDCRSSKGEGVFLCRNSAELAECLHQLQGREILFQEYIEESAGHDLRAFVIGHQVVASMQRIADPESGDFRANLSLGGTAVAASLSAGEASLCVLAAQKLGLDYAGVDLLRSNRGPLILEINPCPGLEGIEKCSGVNVAQEVVLYAESLYSRRL